MDGPAQRQSAEAAESTEVSESTDAAEVDDLSLGDYLRNRRGRLSPEEAGFPAGGRRRTPGLRREELALLAGISVDYLTRLEQGRESNPSMEVLDALGRALHFGPAEHSHMKHLANGSSRRDLCPNALPETPLDGSTVALLDRLDPTPAFVLEQTGEVKAWNCAYGGLMAATGLFDLDPPNLLRFTFLVPAARSLYQDWDEVALEQLANLRAATALWPGDPRFRDLVGELAMESPAFASLWACQEVSAQRRGRQRVDHPEVGELTLDFEALSVAGCGDRLLMTYLPADEETSRRVEKLATDGESYLPGPAVVAPHGAGHLRVVQ